MQIDGREFQYERPWLYDKQEEAFFTDARISVCEASTKAGKTFGAICWIFEKAIKGGPGKNYWWVAPVSNQSDIAWRRMKRAVPKHLYTKNENKMVMTLANGAAIWFKTGDEPDNLYGEDVYACVIDEASRVKQESWWAIRSTLTKTKGPVRIIGNVKGRGNWAFKLARRAENDTTGDMKYSKITAYDAVEAGVLDAEEIEHAKNTLPENVFRELYLAEPGDDGGNPFGIQHIEACIFRDENGKYIERPRDTKPIVWGWDVAKSMNYTVGIALDKNGDVCRFHRWKDSWEATLRRVIKFTQGLPTLMDSTGSGDQLLERLKREGGHNFEGYKFTGRSKQDLMIGLAVAIQNREIGYPDGEIVKELELFEYETRREYVIYSAPDGYHDDCVDALALAVRLWNSQARYTSGVGPISMEQVAPFKI